MDAASDPVPYADTFSHERERLLSALGALTDGGIVEGIAHIGSTSLQDLDGSGVVDIGMSVWPFPLEPEWRAALYTLGYAPVPGYEDTPEQRFRDATGAFQLLLVEPGSERWSDLLLLRDFLRYDDVARASYMAGRLAGSKEATFPRFLDEARRWWVAHHGFGPVEAAAYEMEGFGRPWYVSSGWAIDLFLGRVTRVHHDVDIVIARDDQIALREHLEPRGWKFVTPFAKRLEPWPPHMRLEPPRMQVHAHRADGAFLDFLLSQISGSVWRFRRDPSILRTEERMGLRTRTGTPFLAPELVLLFKSGSKGGGAGSGRDRDRADFENTVPLLTPEQRAWLRWALIATEPEHPWLAELT